jgi:hypothetical protein
MISMKKGLESGNMHESMLIAPHMKSELHDTESRFPRYFKKSTDVWRDDLV